MQSHQETHHLPPPRNQPELAPEPMAEQDEEEPDSAALLILSGILSSSPEEVIASASLSPPDDYKQFQELLRRMAGSLQIPRVI